MKDFKSFDETSCVQAATYRTPKEYKEWHIIHPTCTCMCVHVVSYESIIWLDMKLDSLLNFSKKKQL